LQSRPYAVALEALILAVMMTAAVVVLHGRFVSATPCSPTRPHAAGTFAGNLLTSWGTRTYRLHVPPSYSGTQAVPLVLDFHGLGSNGGEQELVSGLSDLADTPEGGFIVVYPDGTLVGPPVSQFSHWNTTQLAPPEPDDVAFIDQLITGIQSELCVDAARVFATGMSNGAMMSIRLACSLSSRIAATAPVAGAYYPPLLDSTPDETCPDTRPVPFIGFHGTADGVVPFNGGAGIFGLSFRLPIDNTTSAPDVLESWAGHNGCTSGRIEDPVSANVRLAHYEACAGGASTLLYIVDGGDHYWPGSPYHAPVTTTEISATDLMWAFFQQHPLGPKSAPPTATPKDPDADTDGDTIPNSVDDDDDSDGCLDSDELLPASSVNMGGGRNPHQFWDFYDVWTRPDPVGQPNFWVRDKFVSAGGDVLTVARRFGATRPGGPPTKGTALAEALTPPVSDTGYHASLDRGPLVGPNPWNLGPADGFIGAAPDVLGVAGQFGHNCL